MDNKKSIAAQFSFISTLKVIAQVYEETSIIKIKKVRTNVLNTRDYLANLSKIYIDVKKSKKPKTKHQQVATQTIVLPLMKKNGKSLAILLSAGTKLYGQIVQDVYHLFQSTLKNDSSLEVMVVGRLGEQLYREQFGDQKHLYFELPDSDLQINDLKPIIYHILNFEKVIVFHGRFQNIVSQLPTITNITGQVLLEEGNVSNSQEEISFLFEPTIEKIIEFFETQIFTTMFKQTVHESELARYASRVKAMEEALENIKHKEKKLQFIAKKIKKHHEQKSQLERLSRMRLWNL